MLAALLMRVCLWRGLDPLCTIAGMVAGAVVATVLFACGYEPHKGALPNTPANLEILIIPMKLIAAKYENSAIATSGPAACSLQTHATKFPPTDFQRTITLYHKCKHYILCFI